MGISTFLRAQQTLAPFKDAGISENIIVHGGFRK